MTAKRIAVNIAKRCAARLRNARCRPWGSQGKHGARLEAQHLWGTACKVFGPLYPSPGASAARPRQQRPGLQEIAERFERTRPWPLRVHKPIRRQLRSAWHVYQFQMLTTRRPRLNNYASAAICKRGRYGLSFSVQLQASKMQGRQSARVQHGPQVLGPNAPLQNLVIFVYARRLTCPAANIIGRNSRKAITAITIGSRYGEVCPLCHKNPISHKH